MTNYGCFAYLYTGVNYNGSRVSLLGPQNQGDFNSLPNNAGQWNDKINSITTGDSTWVELYTGSNYIGNFLRLGPNTTVRDLYDLKVGKDNFRNAASSIKIFDKRPDSWTSTPGDSWRGPSTTGMPGFVMSDLRQTSKNRKVRQAALDAISSIPTVGTVLEPIASLFWPKGKSNAEVWDEMSEWITTVLHNKVEAVKGNLSSIPINGLAKHIWEYNNTCNEKRPSGNEGEFIALYSDVQTLLPFFTQSSNPGYNLAHLTLFGTVALSVYRIAYLQYYDIYSVGNQSDKAYKGKKDNLSEAISDLRKAVKAGVAQARQWRLDMVHTHKQGSDFGYAGEFVVLDDYTGITSPPFKYRSREYKKDAEAAAESYVTYARDKAAGPIFDAEMDIYLEVADLWTYFDKPAGFKVATTPVVKPMGLWGFWQLSIYSASSPDPNPNPFDIQATADQAITKVTLYGGDLVKGLAVEIGGKAAKAVGSTTGNKVEVSVGADASLIDMFGASWRGVDRVSFRVQTHDAEGAPTAYPAEAGLGGSDGGAPFAAGGPEGGRGRITGFYGQTDYGGLTCLGCYWSYDRAKAAG